MKPQSICTDKYWKLLALSEAERQAEEEGKAEGDATQYCIYTREISFLISDSCGCVVQAQIGQWVVGMFIYERISI